MNKKSKLLASLVAVCLSTSIFAGCGNKTDDKDKAQVIKGDKDIVVAVAAEPPSVDVQVMPGNDFTAMMVYEPLIRYALDGKTVTPGAAESFQISEDGLTLTFKLPKDIKFSNGDPVSAESVKASFERFLAKSPYKDFLAPISKIEVTDGQTLIFRCSKVPGYSIPFLSRALGGIVNAAVATSVGDAEFGKNTIAYGPLYVKEWVKGSHVLLSKNENYKTNSPVFQNKGPVKFNNLKIRFIPNDFTRISELQAGNVDMVVDVPMESIDAIKNNKDIDLYEGKANAITFLQVNTQKAPLDNVNVRKAIALAINKEELKTALNGHVEPLYGPQVSTWIGYNSETDNKFKKEYAFNLENAKKLLSEAGWKDTNGDGVLDKDGKPFKITLLIPGGMPEFKTSGPVIQQQLKNVGIAMTLKELTSGGVNEEITADSFDMFVNRSAWLDSHMLSFDYRGDVRLQGTEAGKKLDALLDEAKYMTDINKRTQLYGEASTIIMDNMLNIPLYSPYMYTAVRKNLKNVTFTDYGVPYGLNDAIKE